MHAPVSEAIDVDVSIPDHTLVSGVTQANFKVKGVAQNCVLQVSINKAVELVKYFSSPAGFWIGINSHLLSNGPVDILFSIMQGERELWSRKYHTNVVNTSDLARATADSMQRFCTPVMVDGLIDATHYDFADDSLKPWFVRPDAIPDIAKRLSAGEINKTEADNLQRFVDDGFVVLQGAVDRELLAAVNAELDQVIASKYSGYEYGTSQRLEGLHWYHPGIRKISQHEIVMNYLRLIFKTEPRCCQTLTYIFGSQQGPHQDTVYLTPFPAGYMCGVWVAIEDVKPNSGELEVYKGSHKLPRIYMHSVDCRRGDGDDFGQKVVARWNQMLIESNFDRIVYRPRAGDVLIWHENLMHAGSPRIDKSLSRRSIVSHVFADGAVAFYDSWGGPGYMLPITEVRREGAQAPRVCR